ncbi:MAG: UDP-N-acetylmuramoyl-L-alanyl-D-glutamate--2,6-diaminopimelate ligase, partial [Clostridia bacterium]|nr:UDP-N-acetylmuramoyl-L-alanyl-D-glutamate--2,6-diaminopimelate ligase [Clostridia bacterium]
SVIENISDHSQKTGKNCLFFCRKGNNNDGEKFVGEAIENGAIAIVSEKEIKSDVCVILVKDCFQTMIGVARNFYGDLKGKIKTVGIVGTNGKTSTCHFISRILSGLGKKSAVIGTVGNYICGKRYDGELTTPGLLELYSLIDLSIKEGAEYFITEISAHAIDQKRTGGIYFDFLIFTNCTEDHLDYFKTFENYAGVKKSLFYEGFYGKAIVNADDRTGREILSNLSSPAISYGVGKGKDVFAFDVVESFSGIDFRVDIFGEAFALRAPLIGYFNVYNLLAAIACVFGAGEPLAQALEYVRKIRPVEGRLNLLGVVNGGKVFVDYAHTPDGLEKTLSSVKKICKGKLYCVFGCGGNREREKRAKMGEISAKYCDFTIITDDNPRFEAPEEIRKEIERGARTGKGKYISEGNRRKAISLGVSDLKEGDALIVAGKGAEKYQEIQGVKYPFDEIKEIEKIIEEKGGKVSE